MKYAFLLLLLLFTTRAIGQNQNIGKIIGDFRFTKDSIQLRWAPDNARMWQLGNQYGYIIDRLLIERNGKGIFPQIQLLTPKPVKPISLADWQKLSKKIERSAIVAQAIYGETFSVIHKGEGSATGRAIQENEEKTQRFGFSALVADQYYEVAKAAALGFTDKHVKTDEVYGYRVYCAIPKALNIKSDTAYIIASMEEQAPIYAPREIEGRFGDRSVQLQWNNDNSPNYFSGYFIERSTDGRNYKIINEEPIVYFQSDVDAEKAFGKKVIKKDSLPANNITYYYRVKGLTPFGELSPPTAVIKGMGYELLKETPVITTVGMQKKDGKVQINWAFPPELNKRVRHFQVRRSPTLWNGVVPADSTLEQVSMITRRYVDTRPISTAYYQIVAIGQHDEELLSYATSMELPDSIPPATPSGLVGKIDTTGVVQLNWNKNTEPDFLGYRVFRSELVNGTFAQITHSPNLSTDYVDTVDIQTTTKYVYYKLVAIDTRGNPSEFSETIRLRRPDIYPPVAPYFNSFEVRIKTVKLDWANSPSEDLDSTWLYRREKGRNNWQKLISFHKKTVSTYTDSTGVGGKEYEYKLSASDESGKSSADEKKYLVVQWLETKIKDAPRLTLEKQKGSILLHWDKLPKVKKTLIFRRTKDIPVKLFKTIWGTATYSLEDTAVNTGQAYSYMIKTVFEDNTESFFSKEATLIFE